MNAMFRRQMIDYVEYHRDPRNGLMHVLGIILLFLGAVLPLSLWHFDAFGFRISLGAVLALPVLLYWLLLDAALGAGILAFAVLFLAVAMMISDHVHGFALWALCAALVILGLVSQAVGHKFFERNNPSLLDHPAHLFLGPMFVMAKLYVALGFRPSVADLVTPNWSPDRLASDSLQGDQHSRP
ncbi:membrane protein [Bradyrhizobium sp. SSBR45G]|uniref:Mpo1-like protein n=1 Tax=unclassified Bradyrhizobium TaxID=2631580 RepID=UPI002342B77A|nr:MULTISPECIES: Mpo1-like protein [unclassified Bradyrhizobium]GLH79499.1 membrane protein [Bradyrhizobium sp. SSBR45G]GLH86876.1 membrane protein [Bradyrhizobium sp. SSBR45R]